MSFELPGFPSVRLNYIISGGGPLIFNNRRGIGEAVVAPLSPLFPLEDRTGWWKSDEGQSTRR